MPSYEYRCTSTCKEIYIKIRSIHEKDPGYLCEKCNSSLERIYSSIGAIFNGNGFYSTDNRKKKQ